MNVAQREESRANRREKKGRKKRRKGGRARKDKSSEPPKVQGKGRKNGRTKKSKKKGGFTLVEAVITFGIMIILILIALSINFTDPNASKECGAAGVLRKIEEAQRQFRFHRVIDVDENGVGEAGYLGELMRTVPLRGPGNKQLKRVKKPTPYLLRCKIVESTIIDGGYCFQMYLPGKEGTYISEAPGGGTNFENPPDPDGAEGYWLCLAWPFKYNDTGRRTFIIDWRGNVHETDNPDYDGLEKRPMWDAAYKDGNITWPIAK